MEEILDEAIEPEVIDMVDEEGSDTQEQSNNSAPKKEKKKLEYLAPYQFKPGQSGNPGGRPKGSSMKEWVKNYLATLDEDERMMFLKGISKYEIWRMAEGNPDTKNSITTTGNITVTTPEMVQTAQAFEEFMKNHYNVKFTDVTPNNAEVEGHTAPEQTGVDSEQSN